MAPTSHHKTKLWLHISAFVLMIGALGCAVIMMLNPVNIGGAPRTPMASRIGLSMGGKGICFLAYQLLSENVRSCRRFASTKANMILNYIETIAWPAAAGVTVYGIMQFCIGIGCTLSYVMIGLAVVLTFISGFSAFISIKEHKVYKATGQKPGDMQLEVVGSADSNKAFNTDGNSVSIYQGRDSTRQPAAVPSYASSSPQQQNSSHNGFVTPPQVQSSDGPVRAISVEYARTLSDVELADIAAESYAGTKTEIGYKLQRLDNALNLAKTVPI
ncbi:hypothetical protein V496_00384 [Pseudogymnoascus sp. VKM F-4515 (FW-2607)]|nr:hypothetical protein V496_00384 [Pseudogymnoascus sp. VKM F-4515 (FW-2607)]